MRVLMLLAQFFAAGQTEHVVDLARGLGRAGHDVTLASPRSADGTWEDGEARAAALSRAGVRMVRLGPGEGLAPGGAPPDIIHAHSTLDFARAEELASRLGVPFVLTIHGLGCRHIRATSSIARADAVIAVGRRVARDISGSARRVVVIENGVDTDVYHPPAEGDRWAVAASDSGFPAGLPLRVLYAGRIDPAKRNGFRELVRAAALLHERHAARLVVLAPSLPALPADLDPVLPAVLDFRGWTIEPAGAFRQADVVVGSGRVIREGMASGRPCLLLGQTYGGLVFPGSLDPHRGHDFSGRDRDRGRPVATLILKGLERLLDDRGLARELGREGRAYALAHLGLPQMVERTMEVYRRTIEARLRAASYSEKAE